MNMYRKRALSFSYGEFSISASRIGAALSLFLALIILCPGLVVGDEGREGGKMKEKYTNRLIHEKSPYLLQHAHNPVDWFPWGKEAFEKAKKEKKLIFLSIGYSTCHWCHVMERESFEDEEVAKVLNKDFVAIKVDREERPDIDNVYMDVSMALVGGGGWPLNILMTPDGLPFFAGSYFPKNRGYGLPGLIDILTTASGLWRENPEKIKSAGKEIVEAIKSQSSGSGKGEKMTLSLVEDAAKMVSESYDPEFGGFGKAPKFPRPHMLTFLLRRYHRTGEKKFLAMVEMTLQKMRMGGIYDQVGYGFHRYSTDEKWFVPHFEKMLYDQAGLILAYLEAYQVTGKEEYGKTVREVLSFVLKDMRGKEKGFYSAIDADSEGEEGKYYFWTKKAILAILGKEEGERYSRSFGVTEEGNYAAHADVGGESPNILHMKESLPYLAKELKVSPDSLKTTLKKGGELLSREREKRIHPHVDDKVITGWNGLMISALARAGKVLSEPSYVADGIETAEFILSSLSTDEGRLLRRYRDGESALPAYADDYAFFIRGLLDLYDATFDVKWLKDAIRLSGELVTLFRDSAGGTLFDTPRDGEKLIFRPKKIYDGAEPSSNSVSLEVFARLFFLTGDSQWSRFARDLMDGASGVVAHHPPGYVALLQGASFLLEPGREIVITGERGKEDTENLLKVLRKRYSPETVVIFRSQGGSNVAQTTPFAEKMKPVGGKATAYVCQRFSCQKPTTDPGTLAKILDSRP